MLCFITLLPSSVYAGETITCTTIPNYLSLLKKEPHGMWSSDSTAYAVYRKGEESKNYDVLLVETQVFHNGVRCWQRLILVLDGIKVVSGQFTLYNNVITDTTTIISTTNYSVQNRSGTPVFKCNNRITYGTLKRTTTVTGFGLIRGKKPHDTYELTEKDYIETPNSVCINEELRAKFSSFLLETLGEFR